MRQSLILQLLLVITSTVTVANVFAADLSKDFDSLGGNDKIIKRAKNLDSNRTVRVVQNRTVDRRMRFELAGLFGGVAGGDSYMSTSQYGGQLDFHVVPEFSLGARIYKYNNSLSSEGQNAFDRAQQANNKNGLFTVPQIDYPIESYIGTLTWYPLYGKINLFDMGVTQFDVYTVAGAGQMKLNSGLTPTYTAGGGIGFWLAQHVSARFEMRWQTYEDQMTTGPRRLNLTIGTVALGFLL